MTQEDINEVISKSTPAWRNAQICSEDEFIRLKFKYYQLLYAVEQKSPGESRHQTALRYIRQAETDRASIQACINTEDE